MTRELTRHEGLFVGGSGGAAVSGAVTWAKQFGKPGQKVLVFLADGGHKYMSKIFNDDWMRENGFLAETPGIGTVKDILSAKDGGKERRSLVTASPASKVREVIDTLKTLGISQLPVVENGKLKGIVAEVDLLRHLVTGLQTLDSSIGELVEGDYATVTPNTKIELLQSVLADAKVAIVEEQEKVVGIVTKIDLIDFLARAAGHSAAPSSPPGA
jgi:cystathionine beta-synthase